MKNFFLWITFFFALCGIALAQGENAATQPAANKSFARQQLSVLVGADLALQKIKADGVTYQPSKSGAISGSYRFNLRPWIGAEADYDFFRNNQRYTVAGVTSYYPVNVHVATANAVFQFKNPMTKRLRSFVSVGGGEMLFEPRVADAFDHQQRTVISIGGGNDLLLSQHLSLRLRTNGYVYKAPDFGQSQLKINKYSEVFIPSVGVVYNF